MSYLIHDKAEEASKVIKEAKIDLSSFADVVTLDDRPLNLGPVVAKIKQIITETTNELNSTENIEE